MSSASVEITATIRSESPSHDVISLDIFNNTTDPVGVKLEQPLPQGIDDTDIGFAQSSHRESWTLAAGSLEFTHQVDWGMSLTTEYAVRNAAPADIQATLQDATVTVLDAEGAIIETIEGVPIESDQSTEQPPASSAVEDEFPAPAQDSSETTDSPENEQPTADPADTSTFDQDPDSIPSAVGPDVETSEASDTDPMPDESDASSSDPASDTLESSQSKDQPADVSENAAGEPSESDLGGSDTEEAPERSVDDTPNSVSQDDTESADRSAAQNAETHESESSNDPSETDAEPTSVPSIDPDENAQPPNPEITEGENREATVPDRSITLAIAGAKGGVGKTTTSINLGTVLAANGISTVVVELDLAMANLIDFLVTDIDVESEATFHDVLSEDAPIAEATYTLDSGLAIVPSGTSLDGYSQTDLDLLPEVLTSLRDSFAVILIDTPAGLSRESIRPIELADEMILVTTPRVSAIRNAENTIEVAERVHTPVRGLILTKSGTGSSPEAADIADSLNVPLLGHIPDDEAIPHSQDAGQAVVAYAPDSPAAQGYLSIANTIADTELTPIAAPEPTDQHAVETISNPEAEAPTDSSQADPSSEEESTQPDEEMDPEDEDVSEAGPAASTADKPEADLAESPSIEEETGAAAASKSNQHSNGNTSKSFGQKIKSIFSR